MTAKTESPLYERLRAALRETPVGPSQESGDGRATAELLDSRRARARRALATLVNSGGQPAATTSTGSTDAS
ncbi:MAG: hypothetical protein HY329_18940 [Chloroflexi bacterium]|nr:hypothetical protein [Chloroflexota bacterium]